MSPKKQTASGLLYLGQPSYVHSRLGLKHIPPTYGPGWNIPLQYGTHIHSGTVTLEAVQRGAARAVLKDYDRKSSTCM